MVITARSFVQGWLPSGLVINARVLSVPEAATHPRACGVLRPLVGEIADDPAFPFLATGRIPPFLKVAQATENEAIFLDGEFLSAGLAAPASALLHTELLYDSAPFRAAVDPCVLMTPMLFKGYVIRAMGDEIPSVSLATDSLKQVGDAYSTVVSVKTIMPSPADTAIVEGSVPASEFANLTSIIDSGSVNPTAFMGVKVGDAVTRAIRIEYRPLSPESLVAFTQEGTREEGYYAAIRARMIPVDPDTGVISKEVKCNVRLEWNPEVQGSLLIVPWDHVLASSDLSADLFTYQTKTELVPVLGRLRAGSVEELSLAPTYLRS